MSEDRAASIPGKPSTARRSRVARLLFSCLLILLLLSFFEFLSWGFFRISENHFHFPNPEKYFASKKEAAEARKSFDRDLGWVVPYKTPYGERPRTREYGRPRIAAFGDSFTHGDEVRHHETWPEQLATLLETDVYNFGASAYGMDQALLRMEREAQKKPFKIHILAFITYDIERNLSIYWKFLSPKSGIALTKPRFILRGDQLELLPNPLRSADEVEVLLREEGFLRRIGENDFWYDRFGLPELGFPFLARLLHKNFLGALFKDRDLDLWQLEEPREIAERILLRFHESSRRQGARALLVHLPVSWEIGGYIERNALPSAVGELERICSVHGLECHIPLLEMGDLPLEEVWPLFTQGAAGGHYSPKGNGFFAAKIAAAIRSGAPS